MESNQIQNFYYKILLILQTSLQKKVIYATYITDHLPLIFVREIKARGIPYHPGGR